MVGSCSSLGAGFVPYAANDAASLPPSLWETMSERPVYLPHFHHPTSYTTLYGALPEAEAAASVPGSNGFRLASFSRLSKLDRGSYRLWLQAIQRLRGHQLPVGLELFREPGEAEAQLQEEALSVGLSSTAVGFFEKLPKREHLERIVQFDLALDTVAVGGMTTALDVLYAGVPLVALPGGRMNSRFGFAATGALLGPEAALTSVGSARQYEDAMVFAALD